MDQINICELVAYTKIGCSKEERQQKQKISLNISLEVNGEKAARTKDLKDSVCYLTVSNRVREEIERKEWVLLEELAYETSKTCLKEFPLINSAQIEVKKYVIEFTEYTSFKTKKISRERVKIKGFLS